MNGNGDDIVRSNKGEGHEGEREEYDHDIGEAVARRDVEVPPVEDGAIDGQDFGAVETGRVGGELDDAGAECGGGRNGGDDALGSVVIARLPRRVASEDELGSLE